jgi:hypothetical protein
VETIESFVDFNSERTPSQGLPSEFGLLATVSQATYDGINSRINEFIEHPLTFVGLGLSSAAIGAGISLAGRSRYLGPAAIQLVPKLMFIAAGTDAAIRLGLPLCNTLFNPKSAGHNATNFGNNLGEMLVDYAALGLTGCAGARLASRWRGGFYAQSAMDKDTQGLAEVVRQHFSVSEELANTTFNKSMRKGLKSYLRGDISPKELRKNTDLAETVSDLNATMKDLSRGLSPYLKARGVLPRVELEWNTAKGSTAVSHVAESRIGFDAKSMVKESAANFADSLGHELTHVEQDVLMWRRQADLLELPKFPDKTQVQKLVKAMADLGDENPSQRLLRAAIKRRQEQPLTQQEAVRADKLLEEERAYNKNERLRTLLGKRRSRLVEGIEELDKNDWSDVVAALQNPARVKKYFANELPGELSQAVDKLAANIPGSGGNQMADVAPERALLRKAMYDEWFATNKAHNKCSSFYMDSFCEREARTIGARTGWDYFLGQRGRSALVGVGSAAVLHDLNYGKLMVKAIATQSYTEWKRGATDSSDDRFLLPRTWDIWDKQDDGR